MLSLPAQICFSEWHISRFSQIFTIFFHIKIEVKSGFCTDASFFFNDSLDLPDGPALHSLPLPASRRPLAWSAPLAAVSGTSAQAAAGLVPIAAASGADQRAAAGR